MKQILNLNLFIFALLILLVSACSKTEDVATGLTALKLDRKDGKTTTKAVVGTNLDLTTIFEVASTPSSGSKEVKWTLETTTFATLTEAGVLTPTAVGTVKVKVTSKSVATVSSPSVDLVITSHQNDLDEEFQKIVSKRWKINKFEPSTEFTAAVTANTDTAVVTRKRTIDFLVGNSKQLNLEANFVVEDSKQKMKVVIKEESTLSATDFTAKITAFQDAISGTPLGVLIDTELAYKAQIKRTILAVFAPDDATSAQITDDATGNSILFVEKASLEGKSSDDAILAKKMVVKGSTNKFYFNEDNLLVVEVPSTTLGTSKWYYEEVK